MRKILLYSVLAASFCQTNIARAYTTDYASATYYSAQPYNLDLYYFLPSDVAVDPNYKARYSAMTLWLQDYYRQWMIQNGYGDRTFGLWTEQGFPDSVRIVLINGQHPLDHYRATDLNPDGNNYLIDEVDAFVAANPLLRTSEHRAVAIATSSLNDLHDLPYYTIGRSCYFTDYPELDLQYSGEVQEFGEALATYFGGFAHELGHALNLPHSHQTTMEHYNIEKGYNLMAAGPSMLTASPTFINRAGSAILANCQLFSAVENDQFYNGHQSSIVALHGVSQNGNLIVSGRFLSDRTVTDINFYQAPITAPSPEDVRVAFSTAPLGAALDSFWVSMPALEVIQGFHDYPPTNPYQLEVELVLANGETSLAVFSFNYVAGTPIPEFDYVEADCDPLPQGWMLTDIGGVPATPGSACLNAAENSVVMHSWNDVPDFSERADAYLYLPLVGTTTDTAEVRLTELYQNSWFLGGLMLLKSLVTSGAFTTLSMKGMEGVFSMWRTSAGGDNYLTPATDVPLPLWLRIVRNGSEVNSYYSTNGSDWTLHISQTYYIADTCFLGLVVSGGGCRAKFDHLRVTGNALSTGIGAKEAGAFGAYPVPADDVLNFPAEAMGSGLRILDAGGRTIREYTRLDQRSLDLADFAPGLYFLRWQQGSTSFVQKLVVAH